LIDRQTLLVAEKTGEDAWGFELGSLGSFTLRYVRPWKQDGIVIGYLELGVEIDNIGTHLANEMNLDILTFIRKDCTTRENFEVGRQIFGFPGQWDAYPDLVMLHQTTPVLPEDLSSWLENSHSQTTELDMANIRLGKRRFACGVIPLFDVAGRNVAKLISLRNVTTEVAETRNSLISVLGLAALLFGGILSLVWSIASAAEKKLGTAVKELQESEVRFKQLAEQNRTIVWEVDTQGLYLYVSQVSKSILGYRPDELVGKMHFYDLHPESGREEFKKAAFAIFAKKEPFQNLKNASQPKDGRQILLSTNGFPLLKVDGTLRGYRGSDTDITERGKAEEALFKSEKKYRSLIEMTHTGFLILDGQGRVLDANAEYVRLSGHHGLGEILGRCVIEWTAAHSREKNNLAVARCVRDGIIQGLELDYKGPDGRITPIEINATVEGTGNDVRIMSLCRDISERKRMEEALVFSNIILRTQQEASIDGILVVSEKDKILSFNQRFVDMWGIPPGIMESKFDAPVLQAVMDKVASPEEFVRRVAHLYKSRNEISMDEIVLKDGRTFDRYSGPMVGAEERYYGRVWYFRDITGRKKAEEELRALNRQIEFILGTTKTGLDIIDSDFNLTYVDPEWQKQYGDYAGKKCYKYFMGKNEPCPNCGATKALEEKKPVVSEEILPAEGNRCIQVTSIPFQDESGNWLVAEVNVDITGRKKTEAAQKEMEGQLHQSQKMAAIGQLAGGIAHDFNNQLAGIVGYADMLYNSLDDAKLKSKAERIIRSSEISAELIKKLMAFSCKGKYLSAPVNVHKVIEEICSLLSHTFDRRIKIKKVLNAKTAMISGDSSQIQNAFLNLALNARDAMPNGGETIFTTEDVDMEDVFAGAEERQKAVKGHWLKICVIDGGTGMDDNVKTHLFEPFFTTKPQGKGTGMGLASVYGTVKHHNGIINVKSTIGEGTEFSMFFPILNVENVKGDENEVGSDLENSVPISAVPRKKSKILLVDDEEMLRSMVSEILTSTGYEVITCNDGLEAVELYRREWKDIDLVLLDMMMPEMNGKDAFMEMRSINGNIKALLISGYSIEGEAQILIDAGMKGFIPKPFNPQVLLKKVGDALGVTRNQ
jgi:PAS domain S-box-containing protein